MTAGEREEMEGESSKNEREDERSDRCGEQETGRRTAGEKMWAGGVEVLRWMGRWESGRCFLNFNRNTSSEQTHERDLDRETELGGE